MTVRIGFFEIATPLKWLAMTDTDVSILKKKSKTLHFSLLSFHHHRWSPSLLGFEAFMRIEI